MSSELRPPTRDQVRVMGQHLTWCSPTEALAEKTFQLQEIAFEHISSHAYQAVSLDEIRQSITKELPLTVNKDDLKLAVLALCHDIPRRVYKIGRDSFLWAPNGTVPAPQNVRKMIVMRQNGQTLDEIGAKFHLTRERVRQLLQRHGGPSSKEFRASREAMERQAVDTRAREVTKRMTMALEEHGPSDVADLASRTGIPHDEVSRYWPERLAHLRLYPQTSAQTWTDEEMLEALRQAALYEFPLTTTAYDGLRRQGEVVGPSVPSITNRFHGWTTACNKAGVEAGATMRPNYESRWTDSDILQFVRNYLTDPEQPSTFQGYEHWRQSAMPDAPSGPTIRKRLGGWNKVKRKALAADYKGLNDE